MVVRRNFCKGDKVQYFPSLPSLSLPFPLFFLFLLSPLSSPLQRAFPIKSSYHVPCMNCSSLYVGETGRKFGLKIKEHKKEVDSFTADLSLQDKGEQCNSQVSHHRPCRGREPCHRLGQGKSRQRGTATDQMDKRGTLDQEDTDVHESGCRILPTQPHMDQVISRSRAPSSCKQSRRDLIKMSDGHRNVVIR